MILLYLFPDVSSLFEYLIDSVHVLPHIHVIIHKLVHLSFNAGIYRNVPFYNGCDGLLGKFPDVCDGREFLVFLDIDFLTHLLYKFIFIVINDFIILIIRS